MADAIKDWVVERNMAPGDRLPGEAELMARFGMAKGTIREAMRILEAQGLIETRTGPAAAVFVGEVTADRAKALLANYFYFKDISISDIYQLRRALEPELAASLAGQLTETQTGRTGKGRGEIPRTRPLRRGGARPACRLARVPPQARQFLRQRAAGPSWSASWAAS